MSEYLDFCASDEEGEINQFLHFPQISSGFPELQSYLNKWTNYVHGWQRRWLVLKDGTLSYYIDELDTSCGCRGAISLFKASIKAHDFDECRFDVKVSDCVWYLRADSPSEREMWLNALDVFKTTDSGYGSDNNLKRYPSSLSVQSATLSVSSSSSLNKKGNNGLKEKLSELESLKQLVIKQIEDIQIHLDAHSSFAENTKGDFKFKLLTFKATASNILDGLNECFEMFNQQQNSLTKRLESEIDKKKQIEEMYRNVLGTVIKDLPEERILSSRDECNNENFYDNVEEKINETSSAKLENDKLKPAAVINQIMSPSLEIQKHRLWPDIDDVTNEQIQYARMGLGKDAWQLFAEEGEMKMYRREEEQNGLVVDPLKACHFVKRFTAREICNFFFRPEFRYEWETTLESNGMKVLETISEDGVIFHQIHKRIWPVAQRDVVFWSHMRQVPLEPTDDPNIRDAWVVVNHSTDMSSYPANAGKFVRIFMTVCLFCQTVVLSQKDPHELTRDDIACKITYCSIVNPGGWAPSSALRIVYKREYPRFLRKFTAYVTNKTKDKAIMF